MVRLPFRAETSYGVLRRITDDEPTAINEINPDIPIRLSGIVSRLMSKKTADRFSTADETASLLEDCLAHVQQPNTVPLPAEVAPDSFLKQSGHLLRKHQRAAFAVIAILTGLLVWQQAEAPDVSGSWYGDEWGQVVLKPSGPAEYTGTYTDILAVSLA